MRILKTLGIITIIIALNSCADTDTAVINTDQPSVTIIKKVYEEENSEAGDEGISWPEFQSSNKVLEKMLNDSLSMPMIIGTSYEDIKRENELSMEEMGMPQGIVGLSYYVNMNDGFMLDITFHDVTLGAHYYYGEYHKRINLHTGEELTIDDIINEENKPEIIKKCNEVMQKDANDFIIEIKANDGEDLTEYYGNIEFSDYDLTKFTITPTALVFEYTGAVPDYMMAYDLGLTCSFNYKEYGYIAKEGSVLADYITNNADRIEHNLSENDSDEESSEYVAVNSLSELKDAINNVSGNTQIVIENDIYTPKPLVISRSNITISGDLSKGTMIYTDDPEDLVIRISNCEDLTVKNLKLRHITGHESCASGVIGIEHSKNITITNCDISGCGAYGITAYEDCEQINITNNKIYDCSLEGIELFAPNSRITGNKFYRNGDGDNDIYIDDPTEATLVKEYNKFLKWDIDLLKNEVDEYISKTTAVTRNFSNNYGSGSVKGYYQYQQLVYMEIQWSEIDAFEMTVYLARQMPQFVNWSLEYGETDAPDGDYEYETESNTYEATFSGWELTKLIRQNNGGTVQTISEPVEIENTRSKLVQYIYKWQQLLDDDNKALEDVFPDMPIMY